jgi:plastocyanin
MRRFRLLAFYVAGVVAVVGLAIWGVSMRKGAAGAGAPQAPMGGTVAPATARVAKVSIDHFAFDPKEVVVTAGTTVTWVNTDDVAHTATSSFSPPHFDSKTLRTDDHFSFEFKTPGTYDYFCKAHPAMTGKVIVK